jgi:hypothetical protein
MYLQWHIHRSRWHTKPLEGKARQLNGAPPPPPPFPFQKNNWFSVRSVPVVLSLVSGTTLLPRKHDSSLFRHQQSCFWTAQSQVQYNMQYFRTLIVNTLNAELKPIRHLLALLRAHHILHVSRIRIKKVNQSRYRPGVTQRVPGS